MKISNETKVGILTTIALALLFIGFNYLKGKDVFQQQHLVHAVFTELGTLEKSNEVKINGLAVGTIHSVKNRIAGIALVTICAIVTRRSIDTGCARCALRSSRTFRILCDFLLTLRA